MAKQKKISKAARTYLTSFILVGGFWGAIEAVKVGAFWGAIEAVKFSGGLSSKAAGLLIPVCAYIMMAISLNLVVGFLGELSLGHAAFMSAGAFAGVFFYNTAGAGMPEGAAIVLAFLIGGLAAGIFGVIVGVPVLRGHRHAGIR